MRAYVDLELSIGDFVLSGGEPAAIVLCDALLRLVPGAIDAASLEEESFSSNLLEYPQYTRPAEFRGAAVPEILLSGNHAAVAAWRQEQSRQRTAKRRPDLLRPEGAERALSGASSAPSHLGPLCYPPASHWQDLCRRVTETKWT